MQVLLLEHQCYIGGTRCESMPVADIGLVSYSVFFTQCHVSIPSITPPNMRLSWNALLDNFTSLRTLVFSREQNLCEKMAIAYGQRDSHNTRLSAFIVSAPSLCESDRPLSVEPQ